MDHNKKVVHNIVVKSLPLWCLPGDRPAGTRKTVTFAVEWDKARGDLPEPWEVEWDKVRVSSEVNQNILYVRSCAYMQTFLQQPL